MQPIRNTIQKGFTLVELLIVVIILALLAAIVVPQFASSTDDAKLASLDTTLGNVRSAIDLYYQQHGEYPGELTAVDAACTATDGTGTGGAGAQGVQAFARSDEPLHRCLTAAPVVIKDANFKFGPYLKKAQPADQPDHHRQRRSKLINDRRPADGGHQRRPGLEVRYPVVGKFIANDTTDPDGAGPRNFVRPVAYDQR